VLNRVHVQIIDNPFEEAFYSDDSLDEALNNQAIAEELQNSFDIHYPSMVHVEYIDLFMEEDQRFAEIRDMLRHGLIVLPVILINGRPFIHGGISYRAIMEEIEKRLSSGPVH
jgi:disulfide oxidoreductase YuzD